MSYKKFTKDVGLLGLTQLINVVSGLITLPIITKFLGAENYGIWVQLMVTMGLVFTFATIQLPQALVRFLPAQKDKKEIQDGIWSALILMLGVLLITSFVLLFFSRPISQFLGAEQLFVIILTPIILFECVNFLLANVFRAFQETKKYCYLAIFQKITETTFVISAVFLGYGLIGAIISVLITKIIFFIIMISFVIKKIGISLPRFLRTKEYLSFCLPLMPTDISYWITQSSDKYIIGFFLGTLFVGYYAPAYTLGCFIAFFMTPLNFLLPAILSKYHDENESEKVISYLEYSLKYFLLVSIPATFGLSILSKQLLTTFSTPQIAQNSYFVVPFITLGMVFFGAYTILSSVFWIKKKTNIGGIIWVFAGVINIALNFLLVPRFGILGAAITTFLAYLFVLVVGYYYCVKELPLKIDWNTILKSTIASTIMGIFVFWFNPRGLFQELIAVTVGVIIYGFLIIILGAITRQELQLFKKIIQKED